MPINFRGLLGGSVVDTSSDQSIAGIKTFTSPVRFKSIETHFDAAAYGSFASIASTTAALQAAAAAWGANGGGLLHLPGGGDLTVNGLIPLPQSQSLAINHWSIDGHWCKLRAAPGYAGVVLGDPLPVNTAAVLIGRMLDIRRLDMVGDGLGTAGQELLRIIGGQNHVVHHNQFRSANIGLDMIFCLGASVAYCEASANASYDIMVRAGMTPANTPLWGDATAANSASNATRIDKCRSYGNGAAVKAQIAVLASDEVEVLNCITEGIAGDVGVLFDALGNTSCRYFRCHNLHTENFPAIAVVKVVPSGGRVVVSGIHNDLGATLIDGRGANTTTVFDLDLMSLPATNAFIADIGGGIWVFRNPSSYGRTDPIPAGLWVGGNRPYIKIERLSNPTQEPGIVDASAVLGSYAGGKFIAADGGGVIAGNGVPGAGAGNDGDFWFNKAGAAGSAVYQKRSGAWVAVA